MSIDVVGGCPLAVEAGGDYVECETKSPMVGEDCSNSVHGPSHSHVDKSTGETTL